MPSKVSVCVFVCVNFFHFFSFLERVPKRKTLIWAYSHEYTYLSLT